jgi:HSP20 family protein
MRLEKWNPFRDLDDIFHNYQRSFLTPSMSRESMVGSEWVPAVDIVEDDKEYQLKVEIPEIPRDAVKLQINHGMLTITGERKMEKSDEKHHRIERYYGSFSRSFTLPDDVKAENVSATFSDGMLYVHMQKSTPTGDKPLEMEIH